MATDDDKVNALLVEKIVWCVGDFSANLSFSNDLDRMMRIPLTTVVGNFLLNKVEPNLRKMRLLLW